MMAVLISMVETWLLEGHYLPTSEMRLWQGWIIWKLLTFIFKIDYPINLRDLPTISNTTKTANKRYAISSNCELVLMVPARQCTLDLKRKMPYVVCVHWLLTKPKSISLMPVQPTKLIDQNFWLELNNSVEFPSTRLTK